MITEMREEFNWEFIFLAANQDACFAADSIGISKENAMNFDASGDGVTSAYVSISNATKSYRTTDKKSNLFE